MIDKKTGGPAFPQSYDDRHYFGMTLRDYFAAKAMQALITSNEFTVRLCKKQDCGSKTIGEAVAELSYSFADEMIKERES